MAINETQPKAPNAAKRKQGTEEDAAVASED
jgi:hypothetical protein